MMNDETDSTMAPPSTPWWRTSESLGRHHGNMDDGEDDDTENDDTDDDHDDTDGDNDDEAI